MEPNVLGGGILNIFEYTTKKTYQALTSHEGRNLKTLEVIKSFAAESSKYLLKYAILQPLQVLN